uniref:Mab-21 domain-containing protein n=2 Tax=Macrostomum lignano TaxID=282301 RepID=A0A1I8IVA0_9PLAT
MAQSNQGSIIIVDKLLERLSSNKMKPILDSCIPDCGFVAFRPFLRQSNADIVFDAGTERKLVVSPEHWVMQNDSDSGQKYVIDLLGFPGSLLMAYRLHGIASMAPQDWWNCIAQCISQQVHLEHRVRRDDISVMSSLQQVSISACVAKPTVGVWLREIEAAVYRGTAHKTELATLLQRSFSSSTEASDLGNLNSAVCAFKYRFVPDSAFREQEFMCGIYGVRMLGKMEDWQHLLQSFQEVCAYLRTSSEDYGIETPWMEGVQKILEMLISTFEHRGRHSLVRRFWKSMLTDESANCCSGHVLHGWLAYLFSCQVIEPVVDLRCIPIDFAVSCLPFTADAFGCCSDYELCTGYHMKFDRELERWLVEPVHECCLFKYC